MVPKSLVTLPLVFVVALGCAGSQKKEPESRVTAPPKSAPGEDRTTTPKPVAAPVAGGEAPTAPAEAHPKKQDPIADVIEGTGKVIGGAGKVVIEGGGKVLEGAGKVVIDGGGKLVEGGGKVLAGAGEVIGGAGVAIGKAVGDVVVTAFGSETKAPDFKLRDLDGRPISLSDFKGSPVVLLFCTTSYPPCVVEMRHLRDLQAKYEADRLKVIAIALDWEGPAALRRFQQEMGLNYPLVWDNGEVFKAYTQSPNVPTTFFIDKNGHIVKKRVGFASATIVTEGASMVGTSMVELDKGFERDLLELLKK